MNNAIIPAAYFVNQCRGADSAIAVFESSGPSANTATDAICGVCWGPDLTYVTSPIVDSDTRTLVIRDREHFLLLMPRRVMKHAIALAEAGIAEANETYMGIQLGFSDVTGGGPPTTPTFVLHQPMTVLTIKGPKASELLAAFHKPPRKPPIYGSREDQFLSLFILFDKPIGYVIELAQDEYVVVFSESELDSVELRLTAAGFERRELEDLSETGSALLSLLGS